VVVLASALVLEAAVPTADPVGVARLQISAGPGAVVSLDRATGTVSFVRVGSGELDSKASVLTDRHARALAFLNEHRSAFGLRAPSDELELLSDATDPFGFPHVRYRQVHNGVPVFGSDVRVHFDRTNRLVAVSATTVPVGALDLAASVPADRAAWFAENVVRGSIRSGQAAPNVEALEPELTVFRTGLIQGVEGRNHLAYDIEVVADDGSVRQFVFIDAHTGKLLDRIEGIHHSLDRRIYASGIEPEYLVWQEGDALPFMGDDADGINSLIDVAEDAYNFFLTLSGGTYASYDAADAVMHSVFDDPSIFCFLGPNAAWNGQWTGYCDGTTADDVVAHEWTHAYSQYTHDLIYQWQPGALNEAYSDIFGEAIDLINGSGSDEPGGGRSADGSQCSALGLGSPADDASLRWLVGEDAAAFGGAIRDMWRPECYGDPGRVISNEYHCTEDDGGGVHTNSGVPNHTFSLAVDGGTFNGETVVGIGLVRALHIYWYAMTTYQGPATDFADHADSLEAACNALIGVDLPNPDPGTSSPSSSGVVISAAHCAELAKAIAATELRTEPAQCGFEPLLEQDPPALCAGLGARQTLLAADWEGGLGDWSAGTRDVTDPATFDTPDWAVVGDLPDGRSGSAAFVENFQGGDCDTDVESGVLYLESPEIAIPADTPVPRIAFEHWVATEALYDGGNLKISVNDGDYQLVPEEAFDVSPYNAILEILTPLFELSDNPLAGESAFTGADGGRVTGSWGASHVNLYGIAAGGDTVRFRFEFGVDGCGGLIGWYVDDVDVYSCADELPPSDCGNGALDPDEVCDDGNAVNEDGCTNTCQVEPGWICTAPSASAAVADPSFEAGKPNPSWDEYSLNFGSPICNEAECYIDLAYDGDWYVWFGGSYLPEEASVSQNLAIPSANPTLRFNLEIQTCDGPSDYLEVLIDDQQVWSVDGDSALCGLPGGDIEVDISGYNDGESHSLEFHSETFAENLGLGFSNFILDVVELPGTPSVCESDGSLIFSDGFESGDTAMWAAN
jgi:cysteine-rich repeat protein